MVMASSVGGFSVAQLSCYIRQTWSTLWKVVVGGTVVGSIVFLGFFPSTVWRVALEGEFLGFCYG
jgi:hypothetical protein